MIQTLQDILNRLMKGDISVLCPENIIIISEEAWRLIDKREDLDKYDVMCTNLIISISQIVYNNTDRSLLFLDDGLYDLLLEKCKEYNPEYQVGAPVVRFDPTDENRVHLDNELRYPVTFIPDAERFVTNALFYEDLIQAPQIDPYLYRDNILIEDALPINTKKNVSVPHKYPKLVGSLDKFKFVLDREAKDRGVYDDPSVKIFERDFLAKHMQMGLFGPHDYIELVLELKYDGVSVEADVTNKILSARSRGDANADLAADMTPIFKDYVFPYATEINESFGMKFEAIITKLNLERLASYGKVYKNPRNAVIGVLSSLDAPIYRNLITLIPLATSLNIPNRVTEIAFMNQYYNSGEYLRYSVISGNYAQVLYQVYRFVQEAEIMRCIMPFMYDGVVVSYTDPLIIDALGRKNSINKYSAAIKFNPLKREAVFTGYSYTVGQNGTITPMIHYTPVEFYGQIHDKSSGHSYARFKDLNLAYGDILNIEYTNDVMPYVTKADVQHNRNNNNSPVQFITRCPSCDTPLVATDSGKKMMCTNRDCPARVLARVVSMVDKLNIKDFGEERLAALGITGFKDLCNLLLNDQIAGIIGEVNSTKLIQAIAELLSKPIYDYQIIGSIGFSDIAVMTWKKILNKVELEAILSQGEEVLRDRLVSIHGIGRATAETIITERSIFKQDLEFILNMPNVIHTFGMNDSKKSIRFTGIRDVELETYLQSKGYDASGSLGLTKSTDILIVPYDGFSSTKTAKASPNTVVVPLEEFKANMDKYLNE